MPHNQVKILYNLALLLGIIALMKPHNNIKPKKSHDQPIHQAKAEGLKLPG